MPHFAD